MAYEIPGFMDGTEVAAADLSTSQFLCVKETSNGINLCTVAGEEVYGVLQNKPAAGQAANVMQDGVSKCKAGAAVAKGALIMTNASGKVITAATAGSSIIGQAKEAAGADGDIIACAINCVAGGVV